MTDPLTPLPHRAEIDAFVQQLLRTGLMLVDVCAEIVESLPEGAYPGEDPGQVVIECLTGTVHPMIETVGVEAVRSATELLREADERTLAHLRLALELEQRGEA